MARQRRLVALIEIGGVRAAADLDRRRWICRDADLRAQLEALIPLSEDYPARIGEYEPDPTAPLRRIIINAGGRVVVWPALRQPRPGAVA